MRKIISPTNEMHSQHNYATVDLMKNLIFLETCLDYTGETLVNNE